MGWEISRLVASGWQAMDVRIRQRMLDAADIGRPDFSKARLLAELNQAHTVHRTVGSIVSPCLRPTGAVVGKSGLLKPSPATPGRFKFIPAQID